MEVASQQGKEIIKTALLCLLRDAVTLKSHSDKTSGLERSVPPFLDTHETGAVELGLVWVPALLGQGGPRAKDLKGGSGSGFSAEARGSVTLQE